MSIEPDLPMIVKKHYVHLLVSDLESIGDFLELRDSPGWYEYVMSSVVLKRIPWLRLFALESVPSLSWHSDLLDKSVCAGNIEARCVYGVQCVFGFPEMYDRGVQYLIEAREAKLPFAQYVAGVLRVVEMTGRGCSSLRRYSNGIELVLGDWVSHGMKPWISEHHLFVKTVQAIVEQISKSQVIVEKVEEVLPALCNRPYCWKVGQSPIPRGSMVVSEDGVIVCSEECCALYEVSTVMKEAFEFDESDVSPAHSLSYGYEGDL